MNGNKVDVKQENKFKWSFYTRCTLYFSNFLYSHSGRVEYTNGAQGASTINVSNSCHRQWLVISQHKLAPFTVAWTRAPSEQRSDWSRCELITEARHVSDRLDGPSDRLHDSCWDRELSLTERHGTHHHDATPTRACHQSFQECKGVAKPPAGYDHDTIMASCPEEDKSQVSTFFVLFSFTKTETKTKIAWRLKLNKNEK